MNTILMVAVVLITLAVIAQAGVLIGMYLMSRRVTTKAETLMDDSRKLMAPLEAVTSNLKTVADDLTETGKIAREHLEEVREIVLDTVGEARGVVLRPIRQYSAIAMGIAEGLRTLVFGRSQPAETQPPLEGKRPAA